MKRVVIIMFLIAMYLQNAMGQCLPCTPPNPADYSNVAGFYPHADTAYLGIAYDREIKIVFPKDTTQGPVTARFTEFKILSITNIPPGLQLVLDRADSIYTPPNNNTPATACAHACGTPTTANGPTDSVLVELFAKTNINVNGSTTAKYHLRVLNNVSKSKAWEMGLKYEVYPNPATNFATLHYAVDFTTDVTIELYDLTGKKWNSFYHHAQTPGDYYLQLIDNPLPNGIYLVKIATDKGETTHKLVINQ
jgi:hypothetical protein